MNESIDGASASTLLFDELKKVGIVPSSIDVRPYPEETILVAYVDEGDFSRAIKVAAAVDVKFSKRNFSGFVTIRKNEAFEGKISSQKFVRGVLHAKAEDLANLLTARSRTSEIQPSLEYVREASDRLEVILTARNHLVFGRRGAGKTTLMVEAKRRLEDAGHLTVWVNMQTHRHSSPETGTEEVKCPQPGENRRKPKTGTEEVKCPRARLWLGSVAQAVARSPGGPRPLPPWPA